MGTFPKRGEVFLTNLNPTRGREIRKTRPCVVISPDELNMHLQTIIVAPLTSGKYPYPFRVPIQFQGKAGYVVVDQLRAIDRDRCVRHMGKISATTLSRVLSVLSEMFAP